MASLFGLGFATQACLRGPGLDAVGPDRIVASLWLFEDGVEVTQVDIDCPTTEPQAILADIGYSNWGCNLVEHVEAVEVTVIADSCPALTAIPGLESLDLFVFAEGGSVAADGLGARWALDRDADDEVIDFPSQTTNAFRYVVDNAWGLYGEGELVLQDLAVVGNAAAR